MDPDLGRYFEPKINDTHPIHLPHVCFRGGQTICGTAESLPQVPSRVVFKPGASASVTISTGWLSSLISLISLISIESQLISIDDLTF